MHACSRQTWNVDLSTSSTQIGVNQSSLYVSVTCGVVNAFAGLHYLRLMLLLEIPLISDLRGAVYRIASYWSHENHSWFWSTSMSHLQSNHEILVSSQGCCQATFFLDKLTKHDDVVELLFCGSPLESDINTQIQKSLDRDLTCVMERHKEWISSSQCYENDITAILRM